MKVAFLDRDGTLCRDYPDDQWPAIKEPELLPGVLSGLQRLRDDGYRLIMLTNQYTIGEGYITLEQYQEFTDILCRILNENGIVFLDIFYFPHRREDACQCCKPQPGMIEEALRKYPEIEMSESILIGDSEADRKLAENVGLPFYQVGMITDNRNEKSILDVCNEVYAQQCRC